MKHRAIAVPSWAAVLALLVVAFGCGDHPTARQLPLPSNQPVPDFSLQNVNPNSTTHDQAVSPRQHLGRITAWYFGHAN